MSTENWDTDEDGDLRPIVAEYDFDSAYDDGNGPYVVEVWVYRTGFESVKNFYTSVEAENYAYRKALKRKARYRVLGPKKDPVVNPGYVPCTAHHDCILNDGHRGGCWA